jgi:hypothetical protein
MASDGDFLMNLMRNMMVFSVIRQRRIAVLLATFAAVACLLALRSRIRNRSYLRLGLNPNVSHSPWRYLLEHGGDADYLCTMGLDRNAFRALYSTFHDVWAQRFVKKVYNGRGRPTVFESYDVLGLTLNFLNSTMRQKTLCQVFSTKPSTLSRMLMAGLKCLHRSLRCIPDSHVRWPTLAEMEALAVTLEQRSDALLRFGIRPWGFVDGLSLSIFEPGEIGIQNAFYNGWTSCCKVTNVFVFTTDGTIAYAGLNFPGSWHDAHVAEGLFDFVAERMPAPFCILGDTAFPRNGRVLNKIVTGYKEGEIEDLLETDPQEYYRLKEREKAVLSLRNCAEMGNRGLEGTFGRLHVHLPCDMKLRLRILSCIVLLYNFRCRRFLPNQLRTMFNQSWSRDQLFDTEDTNDRALLRYRHR